MAGNCWAACCAAAPPDLIFTDIKMDGLDGLDATKLPSTSGKPIPIILVSAYSDQATLARLNGNPAIMSYLIKPINEADLKVAIVVAMLRFRHFQALQKEATDLRQALEDRKIIERAKGILMHRLKVDEDEAFRRLRMLASEQNLKLVELSRRVLTAEETFQRFDKM